MAKSSPYPPIGDYALISDCFSAALVSKSGSIDWCCMPRMDSASCFGRLLDWERGGFCSIGPEEESESFRNYLDDSLVLETLFKTGGGEARLLDCFTMREGGRGDPRRQLLRIVEGIRGRMDMHLLVVPRLDYGELKPWLRYEQEQRYSVIGGDDALMVSGDPELVPSGEHDLEASFTVRAGERVRLSIMSVRPEILDYDPPEVPDSQELDRRLEETLEWWRRWSSRLDFDDPDRPAVMRSAMALKALTYAPTGAIAAAATTSLPESPGGSRNWDYRYSWIRDSAFSMRSLARIGFTAEAEGFQRFIERSAAGSAEQMQIVYGLGGERRLTEVILDHLEGYRGAKPVRIGNAASDQFQLDAYGEVVNLAWRRHRRGYSPDDDYWRFLLELVDTAAERWREPDRGLWEMRGEPQHFVHSKALCWAALDKGLRLSEECMRRAPVKRWEKTRDEIRAAIESEGYDEERGVFVQAFGTKELDSALLLLPSVDFIDYGDERMVRTTDAICEELDRDGLLLRYRVDEKDVKDGLEGEEGVFLACSFWLVECLAHQGRVEDARKIFDRLSSTSNDLGLFSEEYDTSSGEMLGNFPQGLTHLSHIAAATAIAEHQGPSHTPEGGQRTSRLADGVNVP
jgi:GH15 family glucan-1,4-alpha-glucosidase